mmetsp:Transcript_22901/g.54468  ORF Transcript_22901/g.54468 Transcript_22901/m.54468 type:complete len:395 (+) Transcript_22901:696-1880(+)
MHGEHLGEALAEGLDLRADAVAQHQVEHGLHVLFQVVDAHVALRPALAQLDGGLAGQREVQPQIRHGAALQRERLHLLLLLGRAAAAAQDLGALLAELLQLPQRRGHLRAELLQVAEAEARAEHGAHEGRREGQVDQPVVEQRLGHETAHEGEELQGAGGDAAALLVLLDDGGEEARRGVHVLLGLAVLALLRRRAAALVAPEAQLRALQLARDQRVELEGRPQASANLVKVLDLEQRLVAGVELHHLERRVEHARAGDAHLLPRQPADAEVGAAACVGGGILRLRLQPLQGARQAEGRRVQEKAARLEADQERKGAGELGAPRRQRARAERERVLQLPRELGVELPVKEGRLRQQGALAWSRLLGAVEQAAPALAQRVEQPKQVHHRGRGLAV